MTKADITFKSGATITVDLKSFTRKKNVLGEVTAMEWEHGKDRLIHLNIDDVAAIVWHDNGGDRK